MPTILVIEDDDFIRDILKYSLKKENFSVKEASNGEEALKIIKSEKVDMILLDVMLPDTDGFSLFKIISAETSLPVVFLTAKDDLSDRLIGLNIGAEDYITKPFDIREVVARINIVLRRFAKDESLLRDDKIVLNNRIAINKNGHEVLVDNKKISLKPKEYQLLITLVENRNIVLSREKLLNRVWGYNFEGDSRTVDVHIQRLRKKLGDTKENSIIETVFGVGYKMI